MCSDAFPLETRLQAGKPSPGVSTHYTSLAHGPHPDVEQASLSLGLGTQSLRHRTGLHAHCAEFCRGLGPFFRVPLPSFSSYRESVYSSHLRGKREGEDLTPPEAQLPVVGAFLSLTMPRAKDSSV